MAKPKKHTMNLKKQLSLYLDSKKITATQLSKMSGVSKQTLSLWLSGSNPKHIEHVKQVADALETTVDHLVFGQGIEKPDVSRLLLDNFFGDKWISGLFEVKIRRVIR